MHLSFRHLLTVYLLISASAAGAAFDAHPATAATRQWASLADTVFRHLAHSETGRAIALAQDGQGFMWLGTETGLVRWDGYRFRVYQADPKNKAALPDNDILVLHTDERGGLWIGTRSGGLAHYDPETDGFVTYGPGPGRLSSPTIHVIAADGAGGLWIGTAAGLDHVDPTTGSVRHQPLDGPRKGAVHTVLRDGGGSLWVGTHTGLLHRSPGSEQFVAVAVDAPDGSVLAVTRLFQDSAARVWVGARPGGLFVIEPGEPSTHKRARAVHASGVESRRVVDHVLSIIEATPGEIWIGTYGSGVMVVDTGDIVDGVGTWRTRRLRHQGAVNASLRDDDVSALLRDRSGLVWVSTNTALSLHDPRQRGISTLFGAAGGDQPITAADITSLLPTADGRVWLSVGVRGIDIVDSVAGRVGELRPDATRPTRALPEGRVLSMAAAPDGNIYIGTRQGLYRADAQGRRVARVDLPGRAANAMVGALYFDAGTLWLGGSDGLWALDVKVPDAPVVLRHEAERLDNQRVTAILRGYGPTLWVGTQAGLKMIDLASDLVVALPSDADDPSALLDGYVASLLLDAQGRLWVATIGRGLQVLEGRDADGRPRFRRLGMREGLPHNAVNKLLRDGQGQVWAATDNGLAVIDPVTYAVRTLGRPQGVPIRVYWSNSGEATATGELLFGGQGGLTVVRPAQAHRPEEQPTLVVTEARASGQPLPSSRFNGPDPPPRIEVASEDQSLMIEFAMLGLAAPEQGRYSYRLKGFDTDWITTDASRRSAAYTNLPPGNYTLELRGSGDQAPFAPSTRDLLIRVFPTWYQTAWYRVVVAFVALLGVAALVQLRTAYLKRRQRELEGLVCARTAELRDSQLQLERIAFFDPLTGLPNRRRFNEDLALLLALAARGGSSVMLLLIDLDRFKTINDTQGHDAGDALLVEVAQRLGDCLRQSDRVARLGGDEFAVLLSDHADPGMADAACARIVQSVAMPFRYLDHTLQVGASIGAACSPGHAADPDALYKCADLALYEAKAAGRNTWRWCAPPPCGGFDEVASESESQSTQTPWVAL